MNSYFKIGYTKRFYKYDSEENERETRMALQKLLLQLFSNSSIMQYFTAKEWRKAVSELLFSNLIQEIQ